MCCFFPQNFGHKHAHQPIILIQGPQRTAQVLFVSHHILQLRPPSLLNGQGSCDLEWTDRQTDSQEGLPRVFLTHYISFSLPSKEPWRKLMLDKLTTPMCTSAWRSQESAGLPRVPQGASVRRARLEDVSHKAPAVPRHRSNKTKQRSQVLITRLVPGTSLRLMGSRRLSVIDRGGKSIHVLYMSNSTDTCVKEKYCGKSPYSSPLVKWRLVQVIKCTSVKSKNVILKKH